MNFTEQITALNTLVADWAVKRDPKVKGLFTSGDFVAWQLSRIFAPAGWSFTILSGPEMITLNDKSAYVRVVGRLEVTFANGQVAHQDDIGIWPLRATNASQGGTLESTAAERYETVEKAARTDCLKNAARNLGVCFAPLADIELSEHIRREAYRQDNGDKKQTAQESMAELFGEESPAPTDEKPGGNGQNEADARIEFYALAGTAIRDGRLAPEQINDLVKSCKDTGWPAALQALRERLN